MHTKSRAHALITMHADYFSEKRLLFVFALMYVYVSFCNDVTRNVFYKLFALANAEKVVTYGAHIYHIAKRYVQRCAASVAVYNPFLGFNGCFYGRFCRCFYGYCRCNLDRFSNNSFFYYFIFLVFSDSNTP